VQLRVGGLFGSETVVLPESEGFASLAVDSGRATWTFGGRVASFDSFKLILAGPGLLVRLPHGAEAHASYYRSSTRPEDGPSGSAVGLNSGTLGISAPVHRRIRAAAEYTRGIDHLELLTIERVGRFTANTVSGALEAWATDMLSLNVRYDYQRLPEATNVQRVGVHLTHRF
jgi:hypothetical protein